MLLLSGDEASLRACRARLDTALAGNGALLHDLITHARLLLGDQPPLPALPPKEAQRRFFATLRSFIASVGDRPQPLVVFLDDLQWTDQDTLSFLDYLLVETATPNVLVIGSYRDNEITVSHPLPRPSKRLRESGLAVTDIRLSPLSSADYAAMIADVLGIAARRARCHWRRWCTRRRQAFRCSRLHFLGRLEQEGHLRQDPALSCWQWDIDAINAQAYSDNVIDLMLDAIKVQLPDRALGLLQVCRMHRLRGGPAVAGEQRRTHDGERGAQLAARGAGGGLDRSHRPALPALCPRPHPPGGLREDTARRRAAQSISRSPAGCWPRKRAGAPDEQVFDIADHFNLGQCEHQRRP